MEEKMGLGWTEQAGLGLVVLLAGPVQTTD